MKYIIMCGGKYDALSKPKALFEVGGQSLVSRTLYLLRERGIKDIAISTNDQRFEKLDVEILHHVNNYHADTMQYIVEGLWVDAFYPMDEPVCYIMGDVLFSREAIKTIVETPTNDVEFFASAPPFKHDLGYIKSWAEPFAFKVENTKHFFDAVERTREFARKGCFRRWPISWELWQVIKDTPLNQIDYTNYTVINDFTCDVDCENDIMAIEKLVNDGVINLED